VRVGLAPYTVRVAHRVGHVAPHPSGPIRGLITWIQQDQQPGALEFVEAPPGFLLVGWPRIVGVVQGACRIERCDTSRAAGLAAPDVVRQILERPLA
jgi:hypothetical protein